MCATRGRSGARPSSPRRGSRARPITSTYASWVKHSGARARAFSSPSLLGIDGGEERRARASRRRRGRLSLSLAAVARLEGEATARAPKHSWGGKPCRARAPTPFFGIDGRGARGVRAPSWSSLVSLAAVARLEGEATARAPKRSWGGKPCRGRVCQLPSSELTDGDCARARSSLRQRESLGA